MSRRFFLRLGVAGASLPLLSRIAQAQSTDDPFEDDIAVAYNGGSYQLVAGALGHLGGMSRFVDTGDVVLLKPNASFPSTPEQGACTDPGIVSAVVSLCLDAGAEKVMVADHPMPVYLNSPDRIRANGIQDATKAAGGEFVFLDDDLSMYERDVPVEGGDALETVDLAKPCFEANVLINLPVLKHHIMGGGDGGASVGLKNLMGLIHDRHTFHTPGPLQQCIAELALVKEIRPDLTIVDATRVMTNNGPGGPGDVLQLGRVIAGTDHVAVDVASLSLLSNLGYKTFEVDPLGQNSYITKAAELGIGISDPETVRSKISSVDASRLEKKDTTIQEKGIDLPTWLPYASLSMATIALGLVGMIHNRRKTRYGHKQETQRTR